MVGWIFCAALLVAGLTAIVVAVVRRIARSRANFRSREPESWPEAELDGRPLFSPALDHEDRGNIDRWR